MVKSKLKNSTNLVLFDAIRAWRWGQARLFVAAARTENIERHANDFRVPKNVERVERNARADAQELVADVHLGPEGMLKQVKERVPHGHDGQDAKDCERDDNHDSVPGVVFWVFLFEQNEQPTNVDEKRGAFAR